MRVCAAAHPGPTLQNDALNPAPSLVNQCARSSKPGEARSNDHILVFHTSLSLHSPKLACNKHATRLSATERSASKVCYAGDC